jgi:hypothetical protein
MSFYTTAGEQTVSSICGGIPMNVRTSARTETAGKQTAKGGGGTVEQQIKALHAQLMEADLKHDPGFWDPTDNSRRIELMSAIPTLMKPLAAENGS